MQKIKIELTHEQFMMVFGMAIVDQETMRDDVEISPEIKQMSDDLVATLQKYDITHHDTVQ